MRRTLFRMRLPLALFAVLVLASLGASSAIFYYVFAAHSHGDDLRLETDHLDVIYPKNWLVSFGDEENFSGTIHVVGIFPTDLRASLIIRIFDEDATKGYMKQREIDDAFSANLVELKDVYDWILERNENATLSFVENGTVTVFNHIADFSTSIIGGYIDNWGNYYNNCTFTFMSFIDDRKITQIVYLGVEKDYEMVCDLFKELLDTKIKFK